MRNTILILVLISGAILGADEPSHKDRQNSRVRKEERGCSDRCLQCDHNQLYEYCSSSGCYERHQVTNGNAEGWCVDESPIENCMVSKQSEYGDTATCYMCKKDYRLVGGSTSKRCLALAVSGGKKDANAFESDDAYWKIVSSSSSDPSNANLWLLEQANCKFGYKPTRTLQEVSGVLGNQNQCLKEDTLSSQLKETANCIKYGSSATNDYPEYVQSMINTAKSGNSLVYGTGKVANGAGGICVRCAPGYKLFAHILYEKTDTIAVPVMSCIKITGELRACDNYNIGYNGFCSTCNTKLGFWSKGAIPNAETNVACTNGDLTVGSMKFIKISSIVGVILLFFFFK
ncbi:MAG: hypothetical protein KDC88_09750 [Ignavibacteriae bacterium]|nr:hypothetical protein [Ignavibacteriota bacterium]